MPITLAQKTHEKTIVINSEEGSIRATLVEDDEEIRISFLVSEAHVSGIALLLEVLGKHFKSYHSSRGVVAITTNFSNSEKLIAFLREKKLVR